MKVYGLFCKNCNKEVSADPKYSEDQFYVCADCGRPIGYRCRGCEEFFYDNRLILHDDLYICKVCGTPQYGYTSWKRNKKGESI